MKKGSVLPWAAAAVVTAGIVALAIHIVNKQEKKEDEEKQSQRASELEEMEHLGVPEETLEQILDKKEGGFTEKLQYLLRHSPHWSDDVLSEETYLNPGDEDILPIHVSQSMFKDYGQLDLYLEMPDYTDKSYTYPKVRDFKDALSQMSKKFWEIADRPFIMLEAWCVVAVGEEKREQRIVRVQPEYYADKKDDNSDGTKKFFESFQNKSTHDEEKEKLEKFLSTKYNKPVEVGKVNLMWRVSFRFKSEKGGIDLSGASKVLKELIDNFEITREGNRIKYESILFHSSELTVETSTRSEMSVDLIALNGETFQIEYPYFD